MELTNEQIQSLAKFAIKVLEDWPDMGYLDGGDLQEMAVASNLLIPHIVHGPCGENCNCAEYYGDDEWQDGVTCYRVVDWLDRVVEHRDEAVGEGADETPKFFSTED